MTRASGDISLRRVLPADLPVLFDFQCDVVANQMAVVNPRSSQGFAEHWDRVLADPQVFVRAVVEDGSLAGSVTCFPLHGKTWVGYWLGRRYWGRGIATQAVSLMLGDIHVRPLFARIAASNLASCRVVERLGFVAAETCHSPATDRFPACHETIYRLGQP
ncbi:MAG: GNAT family N-acetyltransferase [Planctomycetota bacterium]